MNCILNLGLQTVELMHTHMEKKYEAAISSCNSIQDVRKVIEDTPGLKEALQDSKEPTKVLIYSLFSRLSLKDKSMLSYSPASEHEIEAFFDILHDIEPDITRADHTKRSLQKVPKLKEFLLLSAKVCVWCQDSRV